jgi:hypothetical protein
MFFINRLKPSVCQPLLLLLLMLLLVASVMLQNKTTEQDRKVHTLHKHYMKYTLHKHSHMRRSDHPSGFSSFDPETFSFAKLIIIITIAYHHKCDKMVNYCKGHNEQQLTCSIGLLPPCRHHLYNNKQLTL